MRDLNKLISYMMRHLVPPQEIRVFKGMESFYRRVFYTPPEMQYEEWFEFSELLGMLLGNPDCEWKEKVARLFRDEDKVPEWFDELSLHPTPAHVLMTISPN